jgi:hypothetical protein
MDIFALTQSKYVIDDEFGYEIVEINGRAQRAPGPVDELENIYYTFSQPPNAPCGSVKFVATL